MQVVYVDTLFFLNLAVDYLLLLLTAKIAGVYVKRRRLLLGALIGALLAVLLYFPPLPLFPALLLKLGSCLVTVWMAFMGEPSQHWPRLCGVFMLVTLVLAGIVMALSQIGGGQFLQNGVFYAEISGAVMLPSFTAVYLLSGFVLGKGRAEIHRSFREVTVHMGTRQLRFRALVDSGNLLRDPLSGQRVMVIPAEEAAGLFQPAGAELLRNLQYVRAEELLPRLRQCCHTAFWLLPAHTAVQEYMMIVFRPEELYIDGEKRTDYLLGLTPQTLEIGGDCRALMGV